MAKEKVYLVLEKETKGPFSVKEVNEFLVSKKITHKNLAWIKGVKEWISLGDEYFQDIGIIAPEILKIPRVCTLIIISVIIYRHRK